MHSLTIFMPTLIISESNNSRKKQVRLFACINNQIDLKIMNYIQQLLKDVVFIIRNRKFCLMISALNYSLPVLYNALMKQKQHVKGEISKGN